MQILQNLSYLNFRAKNSKYFANVLLIPPKVITLIFSEKTSEMLRNETFLDFQTLWVKAVKLAGEGKVF